MELCLCPKHHSFYKLYSHEESLHFINQIFYKLISNLFIFYFYSDFACLLTFEDLCVTCFARTLRLFALRNLASTYFARTFASTCFARTFASTSALRTPVLLLCENLCVYLLCENLCVYLPYENLCVYLLARTFASTCL